MAKPLPAHAKRVYDALVSHFGEKKVNTDTPGQFRTPCPAHDGDGLNMVTYWDKNRVSFQCFSEKCGQDEIREALGLTAADLRADAVTGCTLEDYAQYKHLQVEKLTSFGLRDGRYSKFNAVSMPYWDQAGELVSRRFRVGLSGKDKVRSSKSGGVRLYGMWRLDEAVKQGQLVIVEGESDCHTLWHHGIPAVGIPGAQQVNLVMPDILSFLDEHPSIKVYVVEESDLGGRSFVRLFDQKPVRDRIKVIRLGEFKDPSEMHCDKPLRFKRKWDKAVSEAIGIEEAVLGFEVNELADLRPEVERILAEQTGRTAKTGISQLLSEFLIRKGRLMHEDSGGGFLTPYVLLDGAAVVIADEEQRVRSALHDAGLNPTEPSFRFVVAELEHCALKRGPCVQLCRYSTFRNGKLYVSSGPTQMVALEPGEDTAVDFTMRPNGYDGILFAADSCFEEWEPAESEFHDHGPRALRPKLEHPPEAPEYDRCVQWILLRAWLAGIVAGYRLPILVCMGDYGSGKSLLAKAVVHLFMGTKYSIGQVPSDARSFFAAAANLPVYAIDNLDGEPPVWMDDALAAATTGADLVTRTLYTTIRLSRMALSCRFIVTTRTAKFARRKDVEDRVLPLFFGLLEHGRRLDEGALLDEVVRSRNKLLTSLSWLAYRSLIASDSKGGLGNRFQDFAHVVVISGGPENYDEALAMLATLETAQKFGLQDPDPLTRALLECRDELNGTATEILDLLKMQGFKRLPGGGGKHLARRIRECRRALQIIGDDLLEEQKGGTTHFRVVRDVN